MALQTAAELYPVNTTTVDSGTGIDIRLLDSAQAGATDTTQATSATHTQDNAERSFDPGTGVGSPSTVNAGTTLSKLGWALRLAEDMTPGDDTNCNAILEAQSLTVSLSVTVTQSGGSYVGGSYGPTWRVSLWEYDISADTGTLIASGSDSSTTWNYAPAVGDLGTYKTVSVPVTIASLHEFTQGTTLLLQVGLNTGTIPNPTLGTGTWTYTLAVDDANTKITWESGKPVSQVCFMQGAASGSGSPAAAASLVIPTQGQAAGAATASSPLEADAEMTGAASGTALVSASLEADAEMTGASSGAATTSGDFGAVLPSVGAVDIGAGGTGDTYIYPINVFDD